MKLDDIFILMDTQESYIDSGKFFVGYVYDKHILYFCSFKAFKTNSIRYFDELKFLLLMMYDWSAFFYVLRKISLPLDQEKCFCIIF